MENKENKSPIIGKFIILAMFIYASVLNNPLFISIILGFIISLFIMSLLETNDKDIMDLLVTRDLPENILQRCVEILCFWLGFFMLSTILIYNLITNNLT
jgi:hypothetical protein